VAGQHVDDLNRTSLGGRRLPLKSPATVAEAAANLREAALDTITGTSAEAVAIAAAAVGIAAATVAAATLDTAITIQPLMVASAA